MAERGGILSEHPKKFSVVMVKRKSNRINSQFDENHFASVIGKSEVSIFVQSLRKSLGKLTFNRP